MGMSKKVLILVDADVLIHFFKADRISLLNSLYKGRLRMLDIVLDELRDNRTINGSLDMIFKFSGIEEIAFPTSELLQEYVSLESSIDGKGERATLVYCKHNQSIIASSNTRDISNYCNNNQMPFLTTLDILCVAVDRGEINDQEANTIIKDIIKKSSYLCCDTIQKHRRSHFDRDKLLH